jgi:hypothetical protein
LGPSLGANRWMQNATQDKTARLKLGRHGRTTNKQSAQCETEEVLTRGHGLAGALQVVVRLDLVQLAAELLLLVRLDLSTKIDEKQTPPISRQMAATYEFVACHNERIARYKSMRFRREQEGTAKTHKSSTLPLRPCQRRPSRSLPINITVTRLFRRRRRNG